MPLAMAIFCCHIPYNGGYTPRATRAAAVGVGKKKNNSYIPVFFHGPQTFKCSGPSLSHPRLFHSLLTQQLALS